MESLQARTVIATESDTKHIPLYPKLWRVTLMQSWWVVSEGVEA